MKLRYFIINLLIGLLISIPSLSQNDLVSANNSGQYRLALPVEWTRPRLTKAITEILPQTVDELKNRVLCTNCKEAHLVRLILDSVVIRNSQNSQPFEAGTVPRYTYTFSFNYSFFGALVIFDNLEHPLTKLKLVAVEEIFTYSKDFTLSAQGSGIKYDYTYDSTGKIVNDRRIAESTKAVNTDTPNHNARLVVTTAFLRDICEQRIFELRKKIRNSTNPNIP